MISLAHLQRWILRCLCALTCVFAGTSTPSTPGNSSLASASATRANYFVQCKGQKHIVTFRQWDTLLTLKAEAGIPERSFRLMLSSQGDLAPGGAVTYQLADSAANFKVVKYRASKPVRVNGRTIVRTAVNIQDLAGRASYESRIPCYAYPVQK